MPYLSPTWSKKTAENVSCWLCEHFQRYYYPEENGGILLCEGECRKDAPRGFEDRRFSGSGSLVEEVTAYPYWMPKAQIAWCSGFQASLEADIPDPPDLQTCSSFAISQATTPPRYQAAGLSLMPYSKKPQSESCWFCEHFQRYHETVAPGDSQQCMGWCRIEPQVGYYNDQTAAQIDETEYSQPLIIWGASMWCSRWERSRSAVPAVPDWGDGPCITQGGPG